MSKYDYECHCIIDCVSDNGMRFYAGEVYYVDEDYVGEWIYELYSSTHRFMAWVDKGFINTNFTFPIEEIDKIFNNIMDD